MAKKKNWKISSKWMTWHKMYSDKYKYENGRLVPKDPDDIDDFEHIGPMPNMIEIEEEDEESES